MNRLGSTLLALAIAAPFACSHDRSADNDRPPRGSEAIQPGRTPGSNVAADYVVHGASLVPGDSTPDEMMGSAIVGEAGQDDHNTQ